MKKIILPILVIAIVLVAIYANKETSVSEPQTETKTQDQNQNTEPQPDFATQKVASGLYMLMGVNGFTGGNLGLSIGDDGVVLI
ncbi:MAG: hypothetical protein OEY19_12695, partial [Gammaproteobacteria bacterium]|nr:hypothetical protein [Gammaproteobacteria bacterium]